jgi:predicted TIM-barrel fold metal-dependent hydrolase
MTDCHFHLLNDAALPTYRALATKLGLKSGILTQASTQGTDNTQAFKMLGELGPNYRAVIGGTDLSTPMKQVAGVRINTLSTPPPKWEEIEAYARRIEPLNWHLDFFIKPDLLTYWAPKLATLPTPLVFDHFGMLRPTDSPTPLLKLIDRGHTWVKLSAPYRISNLPFPHADVLPLVQQLISHAPERMLWGTDWPHLTFEKIKPDAQKLQELFHQWAGKHAHQILVENPKALYTN